MGIIEKLKMFGKYVAWIVGIVTAPYLTAIAISGMFNIDFASIIIYVVTFFILSFAVFCVYYLFKKFITTEIYSILRKEKLIKKEGKQ